jgi:two-component system, OmpR family, response regulator MprA
MGDNRDLPRRGGGQQLVGEAGDAPVQVPEGLAFRWPGIRVDHSLPSHPAERSRHGDGPAALQYAEGALAQPGVTGEIQPQNISDWGCGVHGAPQIAGVHLIDRAASQLTGGVVRLAGAAPGQPRLVRLPLGQPAGIPGALAVPDEPKHRASGLFTELTGGCEARLCVGRGEHVEDHVRSVRPVCERSMKKRPPSGTLQDTLSFARFHVRVRVDQVAVTQPPVCGGRLLVVDDDPDVRDSLERALRYAGYTVTTAVHGADALTALARSPVDLVVMDVLMPMLDGFDACRRLRQRGDATPILVLTARDAIDDRVTGLEAGADDYLVKPFALRELLARVRALLRRSQAPHEVLGYADLTVDLTTRSVTRGERVIPLTRTEFDLLALLLHHAEQVLGYDVILDQVWDFGEAPASNTLQVFVGFLRRKLEDGGLPRLVHNVRGVGYVLRAAA